MTILYNSNSQKFISDFLNHGYLVDGKPQSVNPPVYELTVINTASPSFDQATQNATSLRVVDLVKKEWRLDWTVTNKTTEELINDICVLAEQAENEVKTIATERLLSEMVGTIRSEVSILSDTDALNVINLYPPYKPGKLYVTGERFYYPVNGYLYKVIGNDHTSQLDWKPDTAVSLYVKVTPPEVTAPWVQPIGSTDAYEVGVKVTHGGFTWLNTTPANVWEPGIYGWTKQ